MNVINSVRYETFKTEILSTHHFTHGFQCDNVKIHRMGTTKGNFLTRYFCFLQFAIQGFWNLCTFRPNVVLYYESYSVLPVYLYAFFNRKVRIFIHYHEFESMDEKSRASAYSKWLYHLEKKLIKQAVWVSQTNEERKNQFQQLFKEIHQSKFKIFPNHPSRKWMGKFYSKPIDITNPLSFIYVGSLGLDTTYIAEFIQWIHEQDGRAIFTIVSQNMEPRVQAFIQSYSSDCVRQISSLPYDDLPSEICKHNVGVVLYNGHSPNYVFNVPNKVNEYLACGLNVWYSEDLVSTHKFAKENAQYPLFAADFSKGKDMVPPQFSTEPFEFQHWHEDAVQPLIQSIKQWMDDSVNTF